MLKITSLNNTAGRDTPSAWPSFPQSDANQAAKITSEEVALLSKYIYGISGIHIEASKAYLVETRLSRLLETHNCATYAEFYQKAVTDSSKRIEKQIIDAITTNETLFFRDTRPFELLRYKIIPELMDKRSAKNLSDPVRIWSAACSTGQEVFSIAIVLKELLGTSAQTKINLIGTDLSDAAIKRASYGEYNKFEIERGLQQTQLQQYFTARGSNWKINDEIRALATFRQMNLMLPFANMGKFDIIFCRNVAIYFTLDDRKKLFDKIVDALEPDGYLIIGSTESLTGICPRFVPKRHLETIFYQVRPETHIFK